MTNLIMAHPYDEQFDEIARLTLTFAFLGCGNSGNTS